MVYAEVMKRNFSWARSGIIYNLRSLPPYVSEEQRESLLTRSTDGTDEKIVVISDGGC